jgi:hypothetical protein
MLGTSCQIQWCKQNAFFSDTINSMVFPQLESVEGTLSVAAARSATVISPSSTWVRIARLTLLWTSIFLPWLPPVVSYLPAISRGNFLHGNNFASLTLG